VSENGTLDFERTVRNLLELGVDGARLNAVLAAMPERFTGVGLNLPRFALANIEGSKLGFFSFLYHHMYDSPGILHVRRVEHMRTDLIQMLSAVGQPITSAIRAFAESTDSAEAGEPGYAALYSNELRDLVAERDGALIAKHNYRFGD
jgi:hypothetical protein